VVVTVALHVVIVSLSLSLATANEARHRCDVEQLARTTVRSTEQNGRKALGGVADGFHLHAHSRERSLQSKRRTLATA
jgi:hypothetical protein